MVAHGQMNEHMLERIMVEFLDRKHDVLVSTTIVESGLDIPNANTLIVDRADAYGLSQLHQLRGRVGRGSERAYAYFLFPPEKPLTETAHERLATIAQHTEMGAGMYVALKDLEIRGAGNLLGGEQSGHIAGVGLRPVRADDRRGGQRAARRRAGRAGRGPGGAAGQRAHPARVRARRAAAAGGLHPDRRHRLRRATSPRCTEELTDRYGPPPEPVLEPARGGAAACPGPPGRADRHHPAGHAHPVLAGGAAGIAAGPGAAAVPEDGAEAGGAYHARTGAQGQHLAPGPRSARSRRALRSLRDRELLAWCGRLVEAVFGESGPVTPDARRSMRKGRVVLSHLGHSVSRWRRGRACALTACGPVRIGLGRDQRERPDLDHAR